jgi:hypothetical protein
MVGVAIAKPLDGAHTKLRRGREHVDAVKLEIERVAAEIDGPPIEIRQQLDAKTNDWVVYVARVAEVTSVSPIVGDAVHNFRSALDYLVHELAFIDGGGVDPPHGKTQFPIIDRPSDYAKRTTLMLENVSGIHRKALQRYQPFKPWTGLPFHPLKLLSDIDNDDKHRLVVTTPLSYVDMPFRFPHYGHHCHVRGDVSGRSLRAYPLDVGTELLRVGLTITGPNPSLEVVAQFQPYLAFVNGNDIITTLGLIGDAVESVLRDFQSFFNRKNVRARWKPHGSRILPRPLSGEAIQVSRHTESQPQQS